MKSRKLGIGLLLLLAFVFTTGTFAYWASSVTSANDTAVGTVTIGTGDEVTTTLSVADVGLTSGLVPTAYGVAGTDDTATFSFSIDWTGAGADGTTGTIAISNVSYVIKNSGTDTDLTQAEIDDMFNITPTDGQTVTVGTVSSEDLFTVVFENEPADQSTYDLVASGVLEITFTITVDPTT